MRNYPLWLENCFATHDGFLCCGHRHNWYKLAYNKNIHAAWGHSLCSSKFIALVERYTFMAEIFDTLSKMTSDFMKKGLIYSYYTLTELGWLMKMNIMIHILYITNINNQ